MFLSTVAASGWLSEPFMKMLKEQGWTVHYACRDPLKESCCDMFFPVCFSRNPYNFDNIRAYRQMKKLLNREKYDIIHCNTPIASMVTRLAARAARKAGTKVIYTAHGFHFYKGAPLLNWVVYYPIEKLMARYTDCLITVNNEDYRRAVAKKFKAKQIKQVSVIGVDTDRFFPVDETEKQMLRVSNGYNENDFILIYVAEFIERKNHIFLINTLHELRKAILSLRIVFAGIGRLQKQMIEECVKRDVSDIVNFVGFRNDVPRLMQMADVVVSPSKQEGLATNVMEGMATGLPVVCSAIRGHVDLIVDYKNGKIFGLDRSSEFSNAIKELYDSISLRMQLGANAALGAAEVSLTKACGEMLDKYLSYERLSNGKHVSEYTS